MATFASGSGLTPDASSFRADHSVVSPSKSSMDIFFSASCLPRAMPAIRQAPRIARRVVVTGSSVGWDNGATGEGGTPVSGIGRCWALAGLPGQAIDPVAAQVRVDSE